MWHNWRAPRFRKIHKDRYELQPLTDTDRDIESGGSGYLNESDVIDDRVVNRIGTEKKWVKVEIGTTSRLLEDVSGEQKTLCVFPKGIQIILASNKNTFDVEVCVGVPSSTKSTCVRVVIPADGVIQSRWIVDPPRDGMPQSEQWCREFGIISREALGRGVVERRDDGTLVVFRKFRHTPQKLTPFGLWAGQGANIHSCSGLTVYTQEQYDRLEQECCGWDVEALKVTAKPLLEKTDITVLDKLHDIDLHMYCPVVLSACDPVTECKVRDDALIDVGDVYEN